MYSLLVFCSYQLAFQITLEPYRHCLISYLLDLYNEKSDGNDIHLCA